MEKEDIELGDILFALKDNTIEFGFAVAINVNIEPRGTYTRVTLRGFDEEGEQIDTQYPIEDVDDTPEKAKELMIERIKKWWPETEDLLYLGRAADEFIKCWSTDSGIPF